ncbi:unnamed protein product [Tenebrio molitor]|nr:unnamed protein product [Tenebrio molitor]
MSSGSHRVAHKNVTMALPPDFVQGVPVVQPTFQPQVVYPQPMTTEMWLSFLRIVCRFLEFASRCLRRCLRKDLSTTVRGLIIIFLEPLVCRPNRVVAEV